MVTQRTELGFAAEKIAGEFLEKRGYVILARNYRKPWGEIDIVCEKEGILVFIEVKASKTATVGFEPELRADWDKMAKVRRTAETFLAAKKYDSGQEWQLDVIAVSFDKEKGAAKIKHFKEGEKKYSKAWKPYKGFEIDCGIKKLSPFEESTLEII